MRALVVEDEFIARSLLQRFLSRYGDCDVAVDGEEALAAVRHGMVESEPYDLVCLDIRLPRLNGHDVLDRIRALEQERGIQLGRGAKVIMTTIETSKAHVLDSFRSGADAYLRKPITLPALSAELLKLQLPMDT